MNCNKCGATDVAPNSAFCTYCGVSITSGTTSVDSGHVVPASVKQGNLIGELVRKAQGQGQQVDDRLVWVLAFMPLLGNIVEAFVAGLIYQNAYRATIAHQSGKFWWVTLAINIGLCWFDERNLRNAGIDTSKFGKMVWLIPVYLYQRASALGHSLAYFITWIVCFVILLS